jgi:hypothetical protein
MRGSGSDTIVRQSANHRRLLDAAPIYLAERYGFDLIFTLERRDFSVYNRGRKHPFRIIP